VIRTPQFRFVRPVRGFDTFAAGELIAIDGDLELRAPQDCTVLMPASKIEPGREAMYLARRL
jgi:hypothetical protein